MDQLDALTARAASARVPGFAGSSGYFAPRAKNLDPHLFTDSGGRDELRNDVRKIILGKLFDYLGRVLYAPQRYVAVWLAGSGITTAWDADRESGGEPGDLDTLLGIDYDALRSSNPNYGGSSNDSIASFLNGMLHDNLWPSTARTMIRGQLYELTYYVNPGVGGARDDILAINPYAAYDVVRDEWTLAPVMVPGDFSSGYFSDSARDQVAADTRSARGVYSRFIDARDRFNRAPDAGHQRNIARELHDIIGEGGALFSQIHDGRHAAFVPGGKGYFDDANYRWQMGKASGAVTATRFLKQLDEAAHADSFTEGTTEHLLLTAAMANGR